MILYSDISKLVLTARNIGHYLTQSCNLKMWSIAWQIYIPPFDVIFVYDQSSSHTKKREYSLIASNINVAFGGLVSTVYDTNIHEIGLYAPTLNVGSMQKTNFDETDDGLSWLQEEIRSSSKFDIIIDGESNKEKKKT